MPPLDSSKRSFLRGRSRSRPGVVRPPWSLDTLVEACNRCDACVEACEAGILIRGDGGFPEVDFRRGPCSFCGDCVRACQRPVFDRVDATPWAWRATVGDQCLSARGVVCRSCGDACEARALGFRLQTGGRALPEIDNSLCNGCGACVAVCPEDAIRMEEAA